MKAKMLVAGFAAALICLIKYPHRVFHGFLWAEDGAVFIKQAVECGVRALWIPYAGYLHAVPRLIVGAWSFIASPERLPHGLAWCCIAVYFAIGASLFGLSRRYFETGLRGDAASFAIAILPFLVPQSSEIYITVTNLQWFLAPVLAFVIIDLSTGFDSLSRRWGSFFLALTGPFGVLLMPLAGVLWLSNRARRVRPMLLYLVACTLQVAAFVSSPRSPHAPLLDYPLMHDFLRTMIGEVFQPSIPRILAMHPEAFSAVACVVLIITLTNGATVSKIGFALFAGAIVLWLIGMSRQGAPGMLIHWDGYGARYLFLPELCIAYALVWICMKGSVTVGRVTALALLCCMLVKGHVDVPPGTDSTTVSTTDGVTTLGIPPGMTVMINSPNSSH